MSPDLILPQGKTPVAFAGRPFPAIIQEAGPDASRRFIEFFTANIRNPNTRSAYAQAAGQFLEWCQARRLALKKLSPFLIAAYVEELAVRPKQERKVQKQSPQGKTFTVTYRTEPLSPPAIKQHLAAIRMLFDWLVIGQIAPSTQSQFGSPNPNPFLTIQVMCSATRLLLEDYSEVLQAVVERRIRGPFLPIQIHKPVKRLGTPERSRLSYKKRFPRIAVSGDCSPTACGKGS